MIRYGQMLRSRLPRRLHLPRVRGWLAEVRGDRNGGNSSRIPARGNRERYAGLAPIHRDDIVGRNTSCRHEGVARMQGPRRRMNIELNFPPKLRGARSRLYRRRFLQLNTRWKALDEIYKIYMLLHRSDLNISENFRRIAWRFQN